MNVFIIIVHLIVCVALILIVLLQTGKGASMGAAFGGSSQTIFGSSGATTFLAKLTTGVAVVFMLTSLVLAFISGPQSRSSVVKPIPAPAQQKSAPVQSPGGTQPLTPGSPLPGAPFNPVNPMGK
jgi:preprotein translocase subunit SecG